MAIDKDFVIKSGLQVNENLIFADPDTDRVGLGTTNADRKLVVIGDAEVSSNLAVGTTVTAQRLVVSGVTTAVDGVDVGLGGTVLRTQYRATDILGAGVGINSANPRYTLEVIGPVSIGDTAQFIRGDLTVTGDISAASLSGQISAGGTVGFTNVTVEKNLVANNAEIYSLFRVQEFNSDRFRFLTAGDPPGIGFTQNADDPEIYLVRGQTYRFDVDSGGFPFYIKKQPTADLNNQYNDGVVNNGVQVGIVTFKVPFNAPNKLYYQASNTAGMGGTISITNDGKSLIVGVLSVTEYLDGTSAQADFENIYVSGIGTINNLKGPQNFSVSAGILTVRQDQTALIGVSTGTDRIRIDEANSNVDYQLTFSDALDIGQNYQRMYVDLDNGQLSYNPSTNILTVNRVVGNLSGIATGADNINIDKTNANAQFQVTFSGDGEGGYERQQIDADGTRFLYNPGSNTLECTNINATTVTAGLAGTATNADFINVDEKNDNTTYQILFNTTNGSGYQRPYIDTDNAHLTYNPSTNTLFGLAQVTSTNFTGDLTGTADQADDINVDGKNDSTEYQVIFSNSGATGYQRMFIDSTNGANSLKYNPGTQTLTVSNFVGNGSQVTNLDGGNVATGVINADRLPDASTTAQGVAQLNTSITSTSTTQAATPSAVKAAYDAAIQVVPAGSRMLFWQAAAPTNWTKLTTQNNKSLRVVSGTGGGTGGSLTFTNAFTNRSVVLPQHNHTASSGTQSANHNHGLSGNTVNASANHSHSGSTNGGGNHAHQVNDPGHSHSYEKAAGSVEYGNRSSIARGKAFEGRNTGGSGTGVSVNTGGSNHSHGVNVNADSANHSHQLSGNTGSNSANHNHTITVSNEGTSGASMDFSVQYIDVIICSKD